MAVACMAAEATATFTCTASSDCHGFPCESQGVCDCGRNWAKPDCEVSFIDKLPPRWSVGMVLQRAMLGEQ